MRLQWLNARLHLTHPASRQPHSRAGQAAQHCAVASNRSSGFLIMHSAPHASTEAQCASPNIEEDGGAEDDGRQQVLLRLCQARDHVGDDLVQHRGRRQQQARVASHLRTSRHASDEDDAPDRLLTFPDDDSVKQRQLTR